MKQPTIEKRRAALRIVPAVPEEDQRTAPERLKDAMGEWLETGPGTFWGDSPSAMTRGAAGSFVAHSGEKEITKSDQINRFELALDEAGFRGGSVVYKGKTKWLLILPGVAKSGKKNSVS